MNTPKQLLFTNPWTDEEIAALRASYPRGGIYAAMRAIPTRTKCAIYRKVYNLDMGTRRRAWTEDDTARLNAWWGLEPIDTITRDLGRTRLAVYGRAQELGLVTGRPEGWEYVSEAARRTGFHLRTLWMILRWAGVRAPRAYCRNTGRRSRHIVEPFDVDEAVEKWMASETLTEASRRLHMDQRTLARHGYRRTRKFERFEREVIDRVVAAELARPGCKVPARERQEAA